MAGPCLLRLACLLLLGFRMLSSMSDARGADRIKSDERVLFFPAVASEDPQTGRWTAEIHGWIYEPETDDIARRSMLAALKEIVDPDPQLTVEVGRRLTERARLFVVDNERGKRIGIRIAGESVTLPASGVDGHFLGTVELTPEQIKGHAANGVITFHAENSGEVRALERGVGAEGVGLARQAEARGDDAVAGAVVEGGGEQAHLHAALFVVVRHLQQRGRLAGVHRGVAEEQLRHRGQVAKTSSSCLVHAAFCSGAAKLASKLFFASV